MESILHCVILKCFGREILSLFMCLSTLLTSITVSFTLFYVTVVIMPVTKGEAKLRSHPEEKSARFIQSVYFTKPDLN